MLSLFIVGQLIGQEAHAWNHTGFLWNRNFFPLTWYMSDYRTDTLDEDYQLQVILDSYANWERDASCAQISTQ